ncbi:MAG: hypothetical protein H9847_09545 [Candidatus Anaerobiospirillum pullicola]|uniref:Uncharacterized protein n=1 Tax=Candidatus Anaerobiospirillum pullicola TaxID=2838451 RepID=A0A948THE4_9GAMM|nr:hypothetical protein [Candidatus Anaerobiospirillum pullicola]
MTAYNNPQAEQAFNGLVQTLLLHFPSFITPQENQTLQQLIPLASNPSFLPNLLPQVLQIAATVKLRSQQSFEHTMSLLNQGIESLQQLAVNPNATVNQVTPTAPLATASPLTGFMGGVGAAPMTATNAMGMGMAAMSTAPAMGMGTPMGGNAMGNMGSMPPAAADANTAFSSAQPDTVVQTPAEKAAHNALFGVSASKTTATLQGKETKGNTEERTYSVEMEKARLRSMEQAKEILERFRPLLDEDDIHYLQRKVIAVGGTTYQKQIQRIIDKVKAVYPDYKPIGTRSRRMEYTVPTTDANGHKLNSSERNRLQTKEIAKNLLQKFDPWLNLEQRLYLSKVADKGVTYLEKIRAIESELENAPFAAQAKKELLNKVTAGNDADDTTGKSTVIKAGEQQQSHAAVYMSRSENNTAAPAQATAPVSATTGAKSVSESAWAPSKNKVKDINESRPTFIPRIDTTNPGTVADTRRAAQRLFRVYKERLTPEERETVERILANNEANGPYIEHLFQECALRPAPAATQRESKYKPYQQGPQQEQATTVYTSGSTTGSEGNSGIGSLGAILRDAFNQKGTPSTNAATAKPQAGNSNRAWNTPSRVNQVSVGPAASTPASGEAAPTASAENKTAISASLKAQSKRLARDLIENHSAEIRDHEVTFLTTMMRLGCDDMESFHKLNDMAKLITSRSRMISR